jgi:hypothetical protein
MWPEVNIVNGRMEVTLKNEPALDDIRPWEGVFPSMKAGDTFMLELKEGDYRTVTVEEVSVSQYEDDEDIYFCIDKDCKEYEVCSDEVNWDTVDRSRRTKIGDK